MAKHWMKAAFSNAHGQFRDEASRAGMSTEAYAAKHAHAPGRLGRRARLALIGMGKDIPGPPKKKSSAEVRYGQH